MLRPEIICFVCKKGSAGHDPRGNCVALRKDSKRHGQLESLR